MAINNIRRFADAIATDGSTWTSWFHKTSTPVSGVNNAWIDLSMGAGTPKYNAYVGGQATATQFTGNGNDGVYMGPNPPSGKKRYVNTVMLQSTSASAAPATILMCDYLMHYPLIDGDNLDQQDMDNTLTLPRYTSGEGVHCMLVMTTPMSANGTVTIKYTNSSGVSGRTSTSGIIFTTQTGQIVSSSNASLAAGSRSPFIPLNSGDKGIRSIESITLTGASGGFFAAVLVKPIMHVQMLETGVATEINTIQQKSCIAPTIENGAYINFIAFTGNVSGLQPFRGCIETSWQ